MKPEDYTAYTAQCFRGDPASCACACPFHLDIRSFLDKVSRARWMAAYKMLRDATVFPVIVSTLCEQPCREQCQRTVTGDEPIALRDIEAAVIRNARDRKPEAYVIPPKEQRIAVVGAGLAGLACALNLAQKKYRVTVFDRSEGWGGCLRTHPDFADFDADIALQFSAVQAEFRFGLEVGSLDELSEFDAVYIATGAGGQSFGLMEDVDRAVFTTREPRVFLGGRLTGADLMGAIAHGVEASKVIEVFLQTGKASRPETVFDRQSCGRFTGHGGAAPAPRVQAEGPDGYTAEEAKAEAARCLQCDCDDCLVACEMLKRFKKDPRKMAVEAHADMNVSPFSSRTLTREAYSCNLCGYCRSICPESVDVGGLLRASRSARMSAAVDPAALHDFWLREMDFATSEGSFVSAPAGKTTCEYAFYPGCQLGAANPDHVLKSYAFLAGEYDAGMFLGCCGAPAYWAGDDVRLQTGIEQTRRLWAGLGRPTLVFACATCASLFTSLLPEIPRVSLYELLAASPDPAPTALFEAAAVFDPCAARDDTGMEKAVRDLAARSGMSLEELAERNRCCGHGGHIRLANPSLYDEITQHRAEASDKPYVVYCANCKEVFASRDKECAHILDLVFGLDANVSVLGLKQKRQNSLEVKRQLMKRIQGVDFHPEQHAWDDLTLIIPDDLVETMDAKLITEADAKEAIWSAETSGDKFYNESDGVCLGSLIRPVITYWVKYREVAPRTFEVLSAYCHRMRFERGE
jgi:hypothetical protein